MRETEFPWTARSIYLNAASIGPLPERTRRAVDAFTRKRAEPGSITDADLGAALARARDACARLIGASPQEIALATNTSFGINLSARGLPLDPGDIVLVSHGEFPANVYPWLNARDRGVAVELIPTLPSGWPDEARILDRLRDARVRVLAVSHVQFHNGYRVDLEALSAACRAHDVFLVVDAIQSLGQVPLDVGRTPVDVLACGAQKWLLSPWGSGFVYVRRAVIERLDPVFVGWMAYEGTEDFSRMLEYDDTLRADARRFEVNPLPFQDVIGMTASVELLLELGVARIAAYLKAVCRPLIDGAERGRYALVSPGDAAHGSALIGVRPADLERTYRRLGESGVVCSLREGSIRFSPHCYNTVEELERVADLVGTG